MPAPVPPPSTIGVPNSEFSPNDSAAIVEKGNTVEDPVIWIASCANTAVVVKAINAAVSKIFIYDPHFQLNSE
jgi:hypothetical protein